MGFIWPSSIIGILPLAPESVSSNSFPIHRWILRMKFLFGKNFFVYSSSYFFRLLPLLLLLLFFIFEGIRPWTLGHRTNYLRVFTVALHANNIWWIPCSRIQFFNLDRCSNRICVLVEILLLDSELINPPRP